MHKYPNLLDLFSSPSSFYFVYSQMAHLQKLVSSSPASPSGAATPNNNYNYDVFVVQYGPDVRKTLTSHLHRRLLLDRFRVCLDDQEMQQRDTLNSQIKRAIATVSVHIAIFSPRFAESKWCLEELVLMLESRTTILPVYYHVKPSDLRIKTGNGEDGVYGRALLDLVNNSRNESNSYTVWIEALSRVADISGLELESCNGDEGELVDKVVHLVEEKVIDSQLLASYPIGLDEKLQDFENTVLLQQQQQGVQTAIVGIVGSAGVGKTTVAMEFFKRKRSHYSRSCFLSDVKEAAVSNSLHSLQNQLIKDLTSSHLKIIDVPQGKEKLSSYLRESRALIIFDDVDHVDQVDAFFSLRNDVLRFGSMILVTSRSKDLLKTLGIEDSSIYNLTGLDREQSQEFFCLHAFHKRLPVLGFEAVVTQFLSVCEGLPLSLKLLGALVYQKDLNYCKTQLHEIAKILPTDIQDRLKICYDGLDEQEKDTFLDIACFFINEDRDMAITIWDASGWEGRLNLENLQNNCLVEIDSKNCIRMNGLLRDLGRDLAKKERFNGRLWRPTDNLAFDNAFQQSTVRGVNMVQGRPRVNNNISLVDTSRLQLLRAEGDCLGSIWNHLTHSDILWLRWNSYPFTNLSSCNPIRNLRVLKVAGDKLKNLWMDESEAPLELRELHIGAAILRFPESIGQLEHLQKIEANAIFEPLPDEFGHLRSLIHLSLRTRMNVKHHLDLSGCELLKTLPESFGNLSNLQHLDLSGCDKLETLPESFGNLSNLQHLDLSSCWSLKTLPEWFGNLSNLQHLDLSPCVHLKTLPESFGNLSNLQHLNLSKCEDLKTLPESFGNLSNLQRLDLFRCEHLETLPESFGNLSNLQHLRLFGCSHLETLPESFGNLSNLQHLHLFWCEDLKTLPESFGNLSNLQRLHLSWCSHLETLPESFGNLSNLQHLDFSFRCTSLKTLPESFGNLSNLQHLNLSGCEALKTLPESFGNLSNLQHLDLSSCSDLENAFAVDTEELRVGTSKEGAESGYFQEKSIAVNTEELRKQNKWIRRTKQKDKL